jgi:hypothetical protein
VSALDRPESGKRRSFSQRVGSDGELAFRLLASANGLIPTKVEEDFGTDFWCQVDLDHSSRKSSAVATTVLGACVRATSSANGVVYLYPGDARNLLSSGTPMVFVLIHLTSGPAASPTYHRLIDERFIADMHAFLKSGQTRMEVTPSDCKSSERFRDSCDRMLEYGYSNRVQIAVAESGVNTVLPNTTVHVRTEATGQLTLVSTVDYFSLFKRLHPGQERQLLHAAFGAEEKVASRIAELTFRSDVIEYLTSLPQPLIFSGFSQEMPTALRVIRNETDVLEPFTFRAIGTHSGYVHGAGISLIFSEARDQDGQMVHETELYIDPDVNIALDDLTSTLKFFASISEGAKIFRQDQDPRVDKGFDVGDLFPALEGLAAMIEGWEVCRSVEGWPEGSVQLRDFAHPEVFNTIVGFGRILGSERPPVSSITVDGFDSCADTTEVRALDTTVLLPVIGNLREHSLVLWLAIDSTAHSRNGETVALELGSIVAAEYEVRGFVDKLTVYPEIVAGAGLATQCYGRDIKGTLPSALHDVRLRWLGDRGVPEGPNS